MSSVEEKIRSVGLVDNLLRAWRRGDDRRRLKANLPDGDLDHIRKQVDACLDLKGGEVTARARAVELGSSFLELNEQGRARFLRLLAEEYGPDENRLDQALADMQKAEDSQAKQVAGRTLKHALESRRVILLRQFNALPQGVKFLVDMRAELLSLSRQDDVFKPLESDLKELLASWFDIGFLELRQITWQSPASLLEKLIAYEAVHMIESWDDLKDRLDQDRRCFAFFHPSMPEEPLIFVEVALVEGIAGNVHELLDEDAPAMATDVADTAIFYSISNAQAGLAGVSFGNFLIKRVVNELAKELPNIKTFSTLSPVPGFINWVRRDLAASDDARLIIFKNDEAIGLNRLTGLKNANASLTELLSRDDWHKDRNIAEVLEPLVYRLCALYLAQAKRRQRAFDPVAHFHLTNGARLHNINLRGNLSDEGMRQSAGIMVNYLYKLSEIDRNHENYALNHEVRMSSAISKALR
jgi:malonyl-CoA decarboxylase